MVTPENTLHELSRSAFPDDMMFGVASSAYQIEGHRLRGAGPCEWDSFAATAGNVTARQNGDIACDHYHRFESDLDLARDLGVEAWRFSTSWARVQPEGQGAGNPEGLDFYDRLVDAMLERGLKPVLTLYHWELPSALADLGGWTHPDIANRFTDFAALVMGRIGDRIHMTATINEPWCVTWLSYFLGRHAPGLRDIRATARAMHHVCLAHGRAVSALRAAGYGNLGVVCNMQWSDPASASALDQAASEREDAIYNRFFIEAMLGHGYPDLVLEGLAPHLPKGWDSQMAEIAPTADWVGLNYYTRQRTMHADDGWPYTAAAQAERPVTDMGWEIYPEGLLYLLRRISKLAPDLPIYITENGMASADQNRDTNGQVQDSDRIAYLDAHLRATAKAIEEGVDVRGYFLWSILDNFEWSFGYTKRFGIVEVDYQTLERRPKASYEAVKLFLTK